MKRFLCLACSGILVGSHANAAGIVTDGSTVGGTTTSVSLDVSNVSQEPNASISNDTNGYLLFTPGATDTNTDWYLTFNGIGIDSSVYGYVQVDFLAAETGTVGSRWQMFHIDPDSTIGGGQNSSQVIGDTVSLSTTSPFSVVIDLNANNTSGAPTGGQIWGTGTVSALRFDLFEGSNANKGKTFTITGVTFGSTLVPEPSIALLGAFGSLMLLRRRR